MGREAGVALETSTKGRVALSDRFRIGLEVDGFLRLLLDVLTCAFNFVVRIAVFPSCDLQAYKYLVRVQSHNASIASIMHLGERPDLLKEIE